MLCFGDLTAMKNSVSHFVLAASTCILLSACSGSTENQGVSVENKSAPQSVETSKKTPAPQATAAAENNGPATPCTEVFLTGTGGGPAPQFGNAQSSVFVRSGDTNNGCNSVRLQFDAGRGTLLNLSRIKAPTRPGFVTPPSLSAVFLTHGHSDHTSSIPDIIETHWILTKNDGQFSSLKPPKPKYKKLPVICFDQTCDVVENALVPWESHEIPSRAEKDQRQVLPAADMKKFKTSTTPQTVWSQGDIKVKAVEVIHIAGSVGYLIETPAGDVCISGDTAYAENFMAMCENAEVIIHEVIHPALKNIAQSVANPDPNFTQVIGNIYKSHTSTDDFGKMNDNDAVMVLTHIIPPIGAGGFQGMPLAPQLAKSQTGRKKGPTRSEDFCHAIRKSGFTQALHVGRDLTQINLKPGNVDVIPPENQTTQCK